MPDGTHQSSIRLNLKSFPNIVDRFKQNVLAQQSRVALLIPFGFGLGVGVYFIYPPITIGLPLWIGLGLLLLGVIARNIPFKLGCYFLGLVAIGVGYTAWHLDGRTNFITQIVDLKQVETRIERIEHQSESRKRLWLRIQPSILPESALANGSHEPIMVRVIHRGKALLATNQIMLVDIKLFPPAPPPFPQGYDFRRYAYLHQISATGFIRKIHAAAPHEPSMADPSIMGWVNGVREDISVRIRDIVAPVSKDSAAVAAALSVGDRAGLSREIISAMQASGLSHLLAISGLHLGLVAMIGFGMMRWLLALMQRPALFYNSKKIAALTAIPCLFIYLLLAGATPPTQRAFIMTGLIMLAISLDRYALSLRPLAIAAMVILMINPGHLVSISFQLSFAAVIALSGVFEWRRGRLARQLNDNPDYYQQRQRQGLPHILMKIIRYFGLIMLTSLVASMATAPFVAYHFGQFSWVAIIANLIAIPLVGLFIMPLLMISLMLMPLGLDYPFLMLAGYGITQLLSVASLSSSLPLAGIMVSPPSAIWLLLFACCAALGFIFTHFFRYVFAGLTLICLALGLLYLPSKPVMMIADNARITGLVQADGIYIDHPRRAKFTQRIWSSRLGLPIKGNWQQPMTGLKCSDMTCDYHIYDAHIAIVKAKLNPKPSPMMIKALCQNSDMVFAPYIFDKKPCSHEKLVTALDLQEKGWHHIYKTGKGFSIETAKAAETPHPWQYYQKD